MKNKHGIGDAPIEARLLEVMNRLARGMDEILNGEAKGAARQNGFILLVFPFEGYEGRANYISNASRKDVVVMLKEQLARLEGFPETKGRA
jgi:hypothetical protein